MENGKEIYIVKKKKRKVDHNWIDDGKEIYIVKKRRQIMVEGKKKISFSKNGTGSTQGKERGKYLRLKWVEIFLLRGERFQVRFL